MKNILGIAGTILIVLGQQLLGSENGMGAAVVFLGASLCVCVVFLVARSTIDRIVAENCRDYYLEMYKDYMEKQQEAMKRIEEEIMKYRKT